MRKLIFLCFALCLASVQLSTAQNSSCTVFGIAREDWRQGMNRDWGHLERDRTGRYHSRIGLLEVGFNGLVDPHGHGYEAYSSREQGFMEVDMARSLGWTFNVVHFATRISRNDVFGLSAALGLTVNDYAFRTPTRIGIDDDDWVVPVGTGEDLKKSKLNTVALHIPVVMELNPDRNFFISAGVFADLVIGSHFKSKFPKEKLKSRAYTNFGQFGVTARVGWRDFYAFGNYGFADLINHKHGPELRPFSFGVGFGF